ncbi:MAG: alpha-amylase family glycosyl hydrolase [Myxococcales bacterium]
MRSATLCFALLAASSLGACGQPAVQPGNDAGHSHDVGPAARRDGSTSVEPTDGSTVVAPADASTCSGTPSATCSVRFVFPKGSESACKLMGTFDDWSAGAAMMLVGSQWEVSLELANGTEVAYKFLLDGANWATDPANPRQSTDGFKNSLLTVSCPAGCAPPDAGTLPPGPDASGPQAGSDASTQPGADAGDPGPCPPGRPMGDFREETIYFAMTTRFFNGDPGNDYYNRDRLELGDPTWRGDFKGLIQQLDYLKELGFTALWITPPVENRSGLDYHGYHAYDFTKIDPRLESPGATYQDLICEVHKRGMRLIQDIVLNHSSNYGLRGVVHNTRAPIKYFRKTGAFPSSDPNYPYKIHLGDYRSANREDDDSPLAPQVFRDLDPDGAKTITCPRCGQQIPVSGFAGYQNHDPNHFFNVDANTLDKTWYHQAGFIAGGDWENPWALQQKSIAGDCMDLNTEDVAVKQHLVDAYGRYLDMGVDALRVDTVKHLERGNLLEYVNAFKARKPGLFVFGENLVKGTGWGTCLDNSDNGPADIRPWWYTRTTQDKCGGGHDDSGFSVLDFSLMSTFRDNLSQGRFGGLSGVFARDGIYGDATQLVTFLDNHDIGPQNDWKYRFAGSDQALASALNLLWFVRGIPCLFYGTEIRFMAGAEIDGNDAPHATSGRAYFGDHLEPGSIGTTKSNKFFKHVQRLNQIRAASPALQKGVMKNFGDNDNAFWTIRDYNNGESVAVVGLSQGGGSISVGGVKGGTYVDAVTGNSLTVGEGGTLTFNVQAGSAGVYLLNGPGKVGQDGEYLR